MKKRYLSKDEFQSQMAEIQMANEQEKFKIMLDNARHKYDRPHIETSKILAIYLFVLFNAIVVYSMAAMWVFADLTYLSVLVSDLAAQVLTYAIYCMKAYHAKKQSEKMKFDRERLNSSLTNILDVDNEIDDDETSADITDDAMG